MSYGCTTCLHAAVSPEVAPCVGCTGVTGPGNQWRPMVRATGTEAEVIADIERRQQLGIAKYGTTVADNPLTLVQWLTHTYEELLDAAIYLKRAINEHQQR